MDSVNNNTMSNNNNSSNINNNVPLPAGVGDVYAVVADNTSNRDGGTGLDGDVPPAMTTTPVVDATGGQSSGTRERSRSGGSRRSRSGRRSGSRHRHSHSSSRRSGRHHSRQRNKQRERNFPAALCSMITIVILSTALAEPRWIRIDYGYCALDQGRSMNYLGAFQFFYTGHFVDPGDASICVPDPDTQHSGQIITKYHFGSDVSDCMINCVSERALLLFKTLISFTLLAIVFSLCSFFLDLVGPSHRTFKLMRRSAAFNIVTVLMCVVNTLFLYWVTVVIVSLQQEAMSESAQYMPQVSFDVSFYLITAAGVTSVVAVACSCLRRYPFLDAEQQPSARAVAILDEQFNDDTEHLLGIPPPTFHGHDLSPMASLPPPPPYTP